MRNRLTIIVRWTTTQCLVAQADPTTILNRAEGVYVVAADLGFYNFYDFADCVLSTADEQLRKLIDLSNMPQQTDRQFDSAPSSPDGQGGVIILPDWRSSGARLWSNGKSWLKV